MASIVYFLLYHIMYLLFIECLPCDRHYHTSQTYVLFEEGSSLIFI